MNHVTNNEVYSHMNVLANVSYALVSFSLFQHLYICAGRSRLQDLNIAMRTCLTFQKEELCSIQKVICHKFYVDLVTVQTLYHFYSYHYNINE
jgi:hypothetical protein